MDYKFEYNAEKDLQLKQTRGVTFEEIIDLIEGGFALENFDNPSQDRYPGQKMYMLDIDGYIWLVPYVRDGNKIFFKTAFPSRKETKKYFGGNK